MCVSGGQAGRTGEHALVVAIHEATVAGGEQRQRAAIGHGLVVSRDRQQGLVDGEVRRVVGDVVVAQHTGRIQRSADGVVAHVLTRGASVGRGDTISRQEAAEGSGQGRIRIAVGLAGGVRSDRRVALVDGEVGGVVGDVVVAQHTGRIQRSADGIVAHVLTRSASVGRGDAIGGQEAVRVPVRVGSESP